MNTAILNTVDKTFFAKNTRFYSLKRTERRAPAPYVFTSKARAQDFIRQNDLSGCVCVPPEKIKQTRPRQASVRNYTCTGRKSR